MLHKVLGCCSCVILAAMLSQTQGRPSQDSLVLRSASSFAQDPSRTLPWSPGGGVMYLPEINAFLVPAESLVRPQLGAAQYGGVSAQYGGASAQYVTPAAQYAQTVPPRRRRPVVNFIKYINENFPSNSADAKKSFKDTSVDQAASQQRYSVYDITPKITELDRTLSANDQILDKFTEDMDETAMILMGQAGQGTRLTLRPIAKAVAGPRGVAVASPIAQAVLRRKDPPPEISYEPDSVAVAGPGGQAYSHPKLIVTYLDENSNSTGISKEIISQPDQLVDEIDLEALEPNSPQS